MAPSLTHVFNSFKVSDTNIIFPYSTLSLSPFTRTNKKQPTATSLNLIMSEEEITAILDKAHGCVESECAVSDVNDLIAELKDQQKVLTQRLETIMNVVAHLQHANESEARKTDDVRAIVKDMLRVFTTQVCRVFVRSLS